MTEIVDATEKLIAESTAPTAVVGEESATPQAAQKETFTSSEIASARWARQEFERALHLFGIDEVVSNPEFANVLASASNSGCQVAIRCAPFGIEFSTTLLAASFLSRETKKAIVFSFNGLLIAVFDTFECTEKHRPDFASKCMIFKQASL